MRFVICSLMFILLLVICANIYPQPENSNSITLQDCLKRAQQFSYYLKAEEQRIDAAEKNYQFKRSQTLPQFSGELSREQRFLTSYNFRQQWALLHGDWSLGNFLLKTAQDAEQNVLIATAEKEQSRLEVSRRAALLYITILGKKMQIDLLEKRLALLKGHHDVAQALWRSGTRTQLDVLQTEAEMSRLQEQIAELGMVRENNWQELAQLINWTQPESAELLPINAAIICTKPVPEFSDDLLARNPLMQMLSFQIKAEEIRKKSVTAQKLPHLYAASGYFMDGDPTADGNYWQVNAGIELSLFQWGATKFQRQESEALIQSYQSQQKNLQRELTITIEQTLKKLDKLKSILDLQNSRLQTAEKAFLFAEANYYAGLITNLDYLSAQQQLTETQIDIQETQLEYLVNLIEFYVVTNQVHRIEMIDE